MPITDRQLKKVTCTQRNGHTFTAEYHEVRIRLIPHRKLTEFSDTMMFKGIRYNDDDGGHNETECYISELKYS